MNIKNILITIGLIAGFTWGGFWLGTKSSGTASSLDNSSMETQTSESDNQGDREVLYWQSPMNPGEIYDEPGKSRMGMELVPVYADEAASSEGMIKINPVVVQNMNVRTEVVVSKDLSTEVNAVGKVEYNEQKLYSVNTKISGWVEDLFVDYTGKMVELGQPLFSIYSPELVTTQQEFLLALNAQKKVSSSSFQSIRDGGNSLLEASRKRLEYWDIPESEIEQLERTGTVNKTTILRAPATGVIIHKNAVEGEFIKAGTPSYKIADLSTVWIQTSVYDYELPWISEGQLAEMELSYQPGKTYKGTVSYIYPDLDQKSRTVQVRLEFQNPGFILKPGMYANVKIQTRPKKNVVVVPNESIIRTGERNIVFVTKEEGAFEPREVILGMEGGLRNNEIEILSGIEAGERVVTSAQFLFDSESRLQEAIQKMLQQKNEPSATMDDMDMEGEMDHSEMDNSEEMDHSEMDNSEEMDHSEMDNSEEMDHSEMDNSEEMDHSEMDNSEKMDHSEMSTSIEMEHSAHIPADSTDHSKMDGNSI